MSMDFSEFSGHLDTIPIGAPEGYDTVTQFCSAQHERQGGNCSIGHCAMADGVAQMVTEASEAAAMPAPDLRLLMDKPFYDWADDPAYLRD